MTSRRTDEHPGSMALYLCDPTSCYLDVIEEVSHFMWGRRALTNTALE